MPRVSLPTGVDRQHRCERRLTLNERGFYEVISHQFLLTSLIKKCARPLV